MASWASRRKIAYAFVFLSTIFLVAGFVAYRFFYKAPTCFDSIQNGSETGTDCGGSCQRLCQSAFLPPHIKWGGSKFEKLADGLYNVSSYIVNPNISGAAVNVPYKMSLYDDRGVLISSRNGVVTLYARRSSLAFQTAINTNKRIPAKASFEFVSAPSWFKSVDNLENIAILDKKYSEDDNTSSLEVTLENKSLLPYSNVQVSVVLYDTNANVIGFSQTRIDSIDGKNGRAVAPFTWPTSRNGAVASIEVLPSIMPFTAR